MTPNRPKLPPWIRVKVNPGPVRDEVNTLLAGLHLNTVCSGAQCPNQAECFHPRTATFMIMGASCTRDCRFCAVPHTAHPEPLEADEPERIAAAAAKLNLKYVVVTSVTRDDLPDGGAVHFARTIRALQGLESKPGVEVLTPDFKGEIEHLRVVIDARPTVFNHNVETVERLSNEVRSQATYRRTLAVLANAARLGAGVVPVKSGLMVGLGETDAEVEQTLRDLRDAGVTILTIGQYLPPSNTHHPLARYVEPAQFDAWAAYAREIGFELVASGPLVRSSYHAGELFHSRCH